MRRISARICTRSLASRFESGSSIRNACGSRTMARPIATRWRWPPESWPGFFGPAAPRGPSVARRVVDPLAHVGLAASRRSFRPNADVVVHGHVRVERVVLEDHRDVAILRRDVVHDPVADLDRAVGDRLQAGDACAGASSCRSPRARRGRRACRRGSRDRRRQRPPCRPGRPCEPDRGRSLPPCQPTARAIRRRCAGRVSDARRRRRAGARSSPAPESRSRGRPPGPPQPSAPPPA